MKIVCKECGMEFPEEEIEYDEAGELSCPHCSGTDLYEAGADRRYFGE